MLIMKMKFIFIMLMDKELFKEFVKSQGLRQSAQRDLIADTFLANRGHSSTEELLAEARKKDPRIGLTTVYRTLKLLTRCGLAAERKFNRQVSYFEPIPKGKHHDHLICLDCGRIMEFENPAIESLQGTVAQEHHFLITHHVLELYGYCRDCAGNRISE
jgi:Fur family transcriptional regulator, ferric uptake regulator